MNRRFSLSLISTISGLPARKMSIRFQWIPCSAEADQNNFLAERSWGLAGLADTDRAGTNGHNRMDIITLGHCFPAYAQ